MIEATAAKVISSMFTEDFMAFCVFALCRRIRLLLPALSVRNYTSDGRFLCSWISFSPSLTLLSLFEDDGRSSMLCPLLSEE